jgi:transposase
MAIVQLTARARRALERVIETGQRGRDVRRAQALVWLSQGVSVSEVARRTRLTRQAVYVLVQRYQERQDQPVAQRVGDSARSGRPATKMMRVLKVLEPLLAKSPKDYGYRAACWTVPMLKAQIDKKTKMKASPDLIRRALKRLRYRYKRPRFVLSRRSPTWRQAKGG